jgi:pimeloyl-ACP methyl ester carboxylesterase
MTALEKAMRAAAAAGTRFDRIDTGRLNMHYARAGSGPPLLLLHGWPEFCLVWQPLMERLAGEFDLVAPDLRGFGDTGKIKDGPDANATADTHAEDLRAFTEVLGLDRFGLICGDVGAYVMQAFAQRYPERLRAILSFCTPYPGIGARYGQPSHLIEVWYQYFQQLPWAAEAISSSRDACRRYIGHFLSHWSGDNPDVFAEVLDVYVDNFMKPGNMQGGFDWYLSSGPNRIKWLESTLPKPPRIEVPTRMLWGKRDPLIPIAWADKLGEYFGDYEIEFVDAGHFVHFEIPDRVATEVRAVFKGAEMKSEPMGTDFK